MAKRGAFSSMQKTLKWVREEKGLRAFIAETFNPHVKPYGIRQDLLGFIDIVGISKAEKIIGIQACGSDWQPHVTKITQDCRENARAWLEAGGRIWLVGWRKLLKKRGGKLKIWVPRVQEFTEADF